ncbi:MAG: hypothetical protein ACI4SD_03605 [Suilimivivens sp.]
MEKTLHSHGEKDIYFPVADNYRTVIQKHGQELRKFVILRLDPYKILC